MSNPAVPRVSPPDEWLRTLEKENETERSIKTLGRDYHDYLDSMKSKFSARAVEKVCASMSKKLLAGEFDNYFEGFLLALQVEAADGKMLDKPATSNSEVTSNATEEGECAAKTLSALCEGSQQAVPADQPTLSSENPPLNDSSQSAQGPTRVSFQGAFAGMSKIDTGNKQIILALSHSAALALLAAAYRSMGSLQNEIMLAELVSPRTIVSLMPLVQYFQAEMKGPNGVEIASKVFHVSPEVLKPILLGIEELHEAHAHHSLGYGERPDHSYVTLLGNVLTLRQCLGLEWEGGSYTYKELCRHVVGAAKLH